MRHIFASINEYVKKLKVSLPAQATKELKLALLAEAEAAADNLGFGIFVYPLLEELKAEVNAQQ